MASGIAAIQASRGGGTRTPDLRFWRPPLYQLSYAPVPVAQCTGGFPPSKVARVAMTLLFSVLAAGLAAVAAYALSGGTSAPHLLVGLAALAVAAWLATLAHAAFRRRG